MEGIEQKIESIDTFFIIGLKANFLCTMFEQNIAFLPTKQTMYYKVIVVLSNRKANANTIME